MELRIYKVNINPGSSFFTIAYSWEHAIVLTTAICGELPEDFSKNDIEKISKKDAREIIIDYNYITENEEKEDLYSFYKNCLISEKPVYGVITDNFIKY